MTIMEHLIRMRAEREASGAAEIMLRRGNEMVPHVYMLSTEHVMRRLGYRYEQVDISGETTGYFGSSWIPYTEDFVQLDVDDGPVRTVVDDEVSFSQSDDGLKVAIREVLKQSSPACSPRDSLCPHRTPRGIS